MNVIVTLVIVLLICAGLGALAGLVWATVKAIPMFVRATKQGIAESRAELGEHEARDNTDR